MIYLLPAFFSSLIGFLALRLIFRRDAPPLALLLFLGAGTGLGLSAGIVFSSLVILGKLVVWYVIVVHALVTTSLAVLTTRLIPPGHVFPVRELKRSDLAGLLVLGLFTAPVVIHALLYPQGGWDAWSCWNLKARFIYLGGEDWKNMFDPILWRSNIAYPLLLPCLNVWGWCFGKEPAWTATLMNSCLITFVTAGLLLFAVKKLASRLHALLAPAWLLSILFVVKLASSQYSDLLVGYYFLAATVSFLYFQKTAKRPWLAVMALSLGFLSFTKSEGMVLALIMAASAVALRMLDASRKKEAARDVLVFITVTAAAFLPTLVFQLAFAPDSHTFINGFASAVKPTNLERFQTTLAYLGIELVSWKWNGFWVLVLAGLLFSWGKCFKKWFLIIPLTLGLYLLAIVGVYWTNTFFEIVWWLSNTLNRILFALAPAVILWVFLALE